MGRTTKVIRRVALYAEPGKNSSGGGGGGVMHPDSSQPIGKLSLGDGKGLGEADGLGDGEGLGDGDGLGEVATDVPGSAPVRPPVHAAARRPSVTRASSRRVTGGLWRSFAAAATR